MFDVCRERVALAGYRLAHSIASIYKWLKIAKYDLIWYYGYYSLDALKK